MKALVEQLLAVSICALQRDGVVPAAFNLNIRTCRTRNHSYGDFTTNIAFYLAKISTMSVEHLAVLVVKHLPNNPSIERITIADPGLINFFIAQSYKLQIITKILTENEQFADSVIFGNRSDDKSIYKIQYTYARIHNLFKQLIAQGGGWDQNFGLQSIDLLIHPLETSLIVLLNSYVEMINVSKFVYDVSNILRFLQDISLNIHSYYNALPLLCYEDSLRNARLCLLAAAKKVLGHGMVLSKISIVEYI